MSYLSRMLMGDGQTHLTAANRVTHTYVIGQPGAGKSRALEHWALQDIRAGHGVAVIDPHGDLFSNIVAHLASQPQLWPRVVIIDPCDSRWVVGFNPLTAMQGMKQERVATFLTDIVIKIWGLDPNSAPRLTWPLTNTFQALAELELTLLDLPRFLLDEPYRRSLLPRIKNESIHTCFEIEFPTHKAQARQWAMPVLNKLEKVINDPDMRLMVSGIRPLDFRVAMDRKLILLVHLPKGIIGEAPSALLGAIIVAQLQKAALSRSDVQTRKPYYLYLDEFQNYTTDNIKDILSESRKYHLSLTLAHQYQDQLSTELRSAVLNTVGTLACFRVGYHDAYQLAKEIFPSPEFHAGPEAGVRAHYSAASPLLAQTNEFRQDGWESLAQPLARLRPREFWMRRRGPSAPHKLRTLDMPDVARTAKLLTDIKALRDASGLEYGVRKDEAERQAAERFAYQTTLGASGQPGAANASENDIPTWGN